MLRDKLIQGVRHERITNRLLAKKTLTYEKALELALAIESAEQYRHHWDYIAMKHMILN